MSCSAWFLYCECTYHFRWIIQIQLIFCVHIFPSILLLSPSSILQPSMTTFDGYKVSIYLHKPLRKIKVVISYHQVDIPLKVWPDICSGHGDMQKRMVNMTPNVLTETTGVIKQHKLPLFNHSHHSTDIIHSSIANQWQMNHVNVFLWWPWQIL